MRISYLYRRNKVVQTNHNTQGRKFNCQTCPLSILFSHLEFINRLVPSWYTLLMSCYHFGGRKYTKFSRENAFLGGSKLIVYFPEHVRKLRLIYSREMECAGWVNTLGENTHTKPINFIDLLQINKL